MSQDLTSSGSPTFNKITATPQWGSIYSTSTSIINASTSYVKIAIFSNEETIGSDITSSYSTNKITINTNGHYLVNYNAAGSFLIANNAYFVLYKNGSIIDRTMRVSPSVLMFSTSWNGILTLNSGDYLEIYGKTTTGIGCTNANISLYMYRIN